MNYAINFYKGCRVLPQANEVILQYTEKNSNLIEYVSTYVQEQRIVIDITNYNDNEEELLSNLSIWRSASHAHENFAIKLDFSQRSIIAFLDDVKIKYFFADIVDTLEVLKSYIAIGVSDVYICNELGFDIKKVSRLCKKDNVNVRVYPNVAQSSKLDGEESKHGLRTFFIRPEDVDTYEPYVDIFEFFGDAIDKQSVLFDIYKDKKWRGNLSDLILGLKRDITNIAILPDFAEVRLNCKKDCENGSKCRYCDKMGTLADLTDKIREESGINRKN